MNALILFEDVFLQNWGQRTVYWTKVLMIGLLISPVGRLVVLSLWRLLVSYPPKPSIERKLWSEQAKVEILAALNSSDSVEVEWAVNELQYYSREGIQEARRILADHSSR